MKPKRASSPLHATHDESTRQALMRAGVQCFAKSGYAGATVQRIAKTAKANAALVNYHFGSKEGLYRACMEEFGRSRLDVAERVLTSPASREDVRLKLRLWMEEILSTHVRYPDHTTILHRDLVVHWDQLRDVFTTTLLEAFKRLVRFLAEAQAKRFLRRDVAPEDLAILVWGALVNTCRFDRLNLEIFEKTITSESYRSRILDSLLTLAFDGMENRK